MKSEGISINDKKDGIARIDLIEILNEIKNGDTYYWSILFMDIIGELEENISLLELQEQILKAKTGLLINWKNLLGMAIRIEQVIAITIIGCRDLEKIQRYADDEDMFETCDVVIQMVDSSDWEVFSKDSQFINRLKNKFKNTQLLETDFFKQ